MRFCSYLASASAEEEMELAASHSDVGDVVYHIPFGAGRAHLRSVVKGSKQTPVVVEVSPVQMINIAGR